MLVAKASAMFYTDKYLYVYFCFILDTLFRALIIVFSSIFSLSYEICLGCFEHPLKLQNGAHFKLQLWVHKRIVTGVLGWG